MANKHMATYLNDHLTGSVSAIELLGHLEEAEKGTGREHFFAKLKAEILIDCDELKAIMSRLQIAESAPRKVAGWLTEKLAELKLRMDSRPGGDLHRLEALEALSLGIAGKLCLWKSLETVTASVTELQEVDFQLLKKRADDQRARVEGMRLEAAKAALSAVD